MFHTTPGVRYRVEVSNNLFDWTMQDEIYGLGHEYLVTMREFTPAPPPPPGTPPANPAPPATNVSLRMQPSSGVNGGTVVSWASLDGNGPVIVRIAGELVAGWNSMALYANRFSGYYYFVWHPGNAIAPPASNLSLGSLDTAMLASLEANLAAMNQQVTDSVARARNAPAPVPPDPNSKRFWRVHVNADVDTDSDGSPDWAEFEIAARGTGSLVAGVTGDAFNADTNGDGIPDGEELDLDLDGIADAADSDVAENSVTFSVYAPMPRYALFPITNAGALPGFPSRPNEPLQISDKGTVLFSNGTWSGGVWTPLPTVGSSPELFRAGAINDHDQILGNGIFELPNENGPYSLTCVWPSPTGVAALVSKMTPSGTIYASQSRAFAIGSLHPGPILSNDGAFQMHTCGYQEEQFRYLRHSQWKVPAGGGAITEESVTPGIHWNQNGVKWGAAITEVEPHGDEHWTTPVQGVILGAGNVPNLPFVPMNIARLSGGSLLAMPPAENSNKAQVLTGTHWEQSTLYADATDISLNGVAIGRSSYLIHAPLLINGKWQTISNYAPNLHELWNNSSMRLLDTTPGGWILAEEGVWPTVGISYPRIAVLLPIRADGVDPSLVPPTGPPAPGAAPFDPPEYFFGGVDHASLSAVGGTGKVPEIWIMAPNGGGSTSVRFQCPLNSGCKLTLESDDDVGFTPGELVQQDMILQVSGKKTATADLSAKLKLGGTLESESIPVKIKAMKKRTVKVAVHKVFGIDGIGNQTVPKTFPTKPQFDDYLNEVYGRQVNTFFDCTLHDEKGPSGNGIDFDFADNTSDLKISYNLADPEVQALIEHPQSTGGSNATANIDIWVFGGGVRMIDELQSYYGYGIGGEFVGKILVDGDLLGEEGQPSVLLDHLLNVMAHEIGHVFVGAGHPDLGDCRSVLVWKSSASGAYQQDFRNNRRLMKSGAPGPFSTRKELIKKEWDLIDAWLSNKVDPQAN